MKNGKSPARAAVSGREIAVLKGYACETPTRPARDPDTQFLLAPHQVVHRAGLLLGDERSSWTSPCASCSEFRLRDPW